MTDPAEAAEFAERRGRRAGRRRRQRARLHPRAGAARPRPPARDRRGLPRPLVLHGASGLPADDLVGAVAAGVVKVNVNAELRRAHLQALAAGLSEVGDDVRALQTRAIEAMARVAGEKIALLAPSARAFM